MAVIKSFDAVQTRLNTRTHLWDRARRQIVITTRLEPTKHVETLDALRGWVEKSRFFGEFRGVGE
jgi:hypothetical protein